ncbi:hypothetical protein CVT24_001452 [Panaeolus cyanescens]|uniref:Uncharacterized protein n=1 Tax=Panaeolus cyanescens TaxID=181874 RepID=A0A409WXY4_9AGAR|nr:hypothetical protein CVT24_001452 [Panaeolus cyanescens]
MFESPTDGLLESIDTSVSNLVHKYHLTRQAAKDANARAVVALQTAQDAQTLSNQMPISSYQEAYLAAEKKAVIKTQNAFSTEQEHEAVVKRLKAILQQPTTPAPQSPAENVPLGVEDESEDDPTIIPIYGRYSVQ